MFDKLCHDNGITHLLTAPYSPTTTGKVERLHKTIRAEFLPEHDRRHDSVEEVQAALGAWVIQYNTDRPHQSCGGRPPIERFQLAECAVVAVEDTAAPMLPRRLPPAGRPGGVSRWVSANGRISLAGFNYVVGATFAGEPVEVLVTEGLVEIFHAGVLVATHAQRLKPDQADRLHQVPRQRRARDATVGMTVARLADVAGAVSFAGSPYACGRRWAGQTIEVSIVAGSVQLAKDGAVIRMHPIRHDRSRELGAFANPKGRPRRKTSA
jgi:hypothetical protein